MKSLEILLQTLEDQQLAQLESCVRFAMPTQKAYKLNKACRFIPLDKNPGMKPIGTEDVIQRIIGKAVTSFLRSAIINANGMHWIRPGCEIATHVSVSLLELKMKKIIKFSK